MNRRSPRSAVVLGASGLVGRHLVTALQRASVQVTAAGRTPPPTASPSPVAPADRPGFVPLDFDVLVRDPATAGDLFEGRDAVFVALGTTLRKAGSREAFRRVDLDYVLAAARGARAAGVPHLLAVSSVGASSRATGFYLQVKGEAEEALQGLGFPSLTLARPSLLLGDRDESRPLETAAAVALRILRPALRGPFARYRPIPAETVARALVRVALDPPHGCAVLESHHLRRLGS